MWLSSGEGGAPPSPPPLGKHDRQEKRHKIASYLSQNSGGGGDDAMMADMHEERSQQLSMPMSGQRNTQEGHRVLRLRGRS